MPRNRDAPVFLYFGPGNTAAIAHPPCFFLAVWRKLLNAGSSVAKRRVIISRPVSESILTFIRSVWVPSTRLALIAHLKKAGILAVFHHVPLHISPMGERMGYEKGMLPVSEDVSGRVLRLTFYYELEAAEVDSVVNEVRGFCRRRTRYGVRLGTCRTYEKFLSGRETAQNNPDVRYIVTTMSLKSEVFLYALPHLRAAIPISPTGS